MKTTPALSLATLALALSACALQPHVPAPIQAGPEERLSLIVPAKGVQIYECREAKSKGLEWAFVAPDAELMDRHGRRIGHHGAGPYWQSNDGSRVVATVKARADAPIGDAVPWLLLAAKNDGPKGNFSDVTSIQRVNTTGGKAPAATCARAGERVNVAYTADYYFFTAY